MMDNEYTEHECALALRRLGKDDELLACWARYHLISDALKDQVPDVLNTDFSARMRGLIDAEPAHESASAVVQKTAQTAGRRARGAWFKPAAGFAVAASVAGVALLGLRGWDQVPSQNVLQVAQQEVPVVASLSANASTGQAMSVSDQAEMAEKLNAYLLNHNELATLNGINGVLPYMRMVNYQASR
jgi:sigma-E factor negative regulatory protein RseA